MIYDSVRFSLEMADYTYSQLSKTLELISKGVENKTHYKAFNYAWSFIDHSQRFIKLYKALNPPETSIIYKLNYLKKFRNAIQHVDINLEKSNVKMLKNKRPIFGTLKWVVNDQENDDIYTAIWVSGIFEINSVRFNQHSQSIHQSFINNISLETDTLNKSDENEISLSKTFDDLNHVVDHISQKLHEQFVQHKMNRIDRAKRKDVILLMQKKTTTKATNISEVKIQKFIASIRPSDAEIRRKLDFGYSADGQAFEIFEIRPVWNNPDEKQKSPFAKIRFYKSKQVWHLYWMRASGKWELYEPFPDAPSIDTLLKVIEADEHHCFFG